jgi:hypothetical protein
MIPKKDAEDVLLSTTIDTFWINGSDDEVLVSSCLWTASHQAHNLFGHGLPSGGDGQKPARA